MSSLFPLRVPCHSTALVAIAGVVLSGALIAGPISGGAFNPVVILVLSILDSFSNFHYALAASVIHLIGAGLASSLFYFVAPEEFCVFSELKQGLTDIENGPVVNDLTPLLAWSQSPFPCSWQPFSAILTMSNIYQTSAFDNPVDNFVFGNFRPYFFIPGSLLLATVHSRTNCSKIYFWYFKSTRFFFIFGDPFERHCSVLISTFKLRHLQFLNWGRVGCDIVPAWAFYCQTLSKNYLKLIFSIKAKIMVNEKPRVSVGDEIITKT